MTVNVLRENGTTPRRRIVYSTLPKRRNERRGLISSSTFECGHGDWTTASDRRRGWVFCFDCFYRKPMDEMGRVILEELREKGELA